jgi:hypothetical protein
VILRVALLGGPPAVPHNPTTGRIGKMAEAKINISLTPAEFDLVRETIDGRIEQLNVFINTKSTTPKDRQNWRALIVQLSDLIKGLKK